MKDLPIRALVVLGRVTEVLVQRLAIHGQFFLARLGDSGDASGGRDVHHIEGGTGDAFGKPQDAAKTQVLREAIVDIGEMLEADPAFPNQLGIHMHDDVVVIRVDNAEPARLRQHLERLPDIAEIDHAPGTRGENVGGEDLQRRIASLDCLRELPGEFRGRLGMQHNVVGPIARTLSDEVLVASLDGLTRRRAIAPIGEIDEGGRAPKQRGASDLLWPGSGKRRAIGLDPHMMKMYVRVDTARHDDAPACIDHPPGRLPRQSTRRGHRRNGLPGNRDIALDNALGRDHVPAANDRIQQASLPKIRFASRRFPTSPPARVGVTGCNVS